MAKSLFTVYKPNRPVKLLDYPIFFSLIMEEAYSNFNIAVFRDYVFRMDATGFVFANVFFNRIIRLNY